MKYKIVRNDVVEIITGNDSGKKERVLQVMRSSGRVVVEHVNFITKHMKRSRDNPYGARLQKEASINISNVLLVCSNCERGSRIRVEKNDEGKRIRVCVRCGREIPKP